MKNFTKFLPLIISSFFCLGSQAQTCPGSLGTTVNIAALPYNGTALTTCGAGNEITASNATICGSSSYYGGEDVVFIFTPTSSGSITISLTSSSSWIGMMLYNGCPFTGQGGSCVGNIQNSSGSKTLTVDLTSGVTYYLVVDTWPSPPCIPSFNLSIPAPVSSDPCSSITTLSCGSAVSATPSGAGAWNVTTCGFSTPGQEKIYSFTPTTTGAHSLQVNSLSGGYIDYFFKAASIGCNSSDWICIDDINLTGNYTIGMLTAGVQYYFLLDPEGTGSYNHNFQIVCPSSDPCASITTLACATPATATLSGSGVWNNSTCFFSTPGQEKVYSFTPTVTGMHQLQVTSATGTGYIDYQYKAASGGCSAVGWICIDDVNFTGTFTIGNLTAGVQYYILLDAESTTSSTQTFQILCPTLSDPCSSITTLACATPATVTLSGTGVWNNSTCFFSTPGQEKVYSFTPTVTGMHQLQVTSATGTGYIDYQYKAASGGCSATGWTCIDDVNFTGTITIGNLTAGVQYYLLLDAESTTSSTQTFQIICPAATPPCIASPISPTNGASFCLPGPGTLSWPSAEGATSYEVYFGASPTPPLYTTTSATSVSVGSLTSGTYYWQIRPANSGGTASGCPVWSFSVDVTPPTISNCPNNQNVLRNASCVAVLPNYTGFPTTGDNCSGAVTVTQMPTPGTIINSTVTVMLTATDAAGNTATCSFTATPVDQTPPTMGCPATQTLALGANCSTTLPDYTGLATTGDNCGVQSVTQSPVAGTSVSGAGNMMVMLTVTDMNNLTTSCTFTVTKVDNTPPTITCPATQTLALGANCSATLPDYTNLATTGDNCGVQSVTQSPVAGTSVSGAGNMMVMLTVTDMNNLTTSCTFTVTKVDNTPPTITCPATQTLALGANCSATLPDYTNLATTGDNCGVQSVTQSPVAGTSVSGVGNMTVMLTVTDVNNLTMSCTFTVTKVDNTPPTITCPATQTLALGANCSATLPNYTNLAITGDNCGVQSVTQSPVVGTPVSGAGNMTVMLTVTDVNNLTTSCTFTVTKVDNTPPTITCPATQTLALGANCSATLPDYTNLATTGDNCGVQSVTQSPVAGSPVSGAGNMTVMLTVTDVNNLTTSCTFTVTKVDNTPPTLVCKNTTVLIGNGGTYTLQPADVFDATASSDNCSSQLVVTNISPATVSCAQLNQTIPVTVTVQDGSGNMATCTAQVTVQEGTALPDGWSSSNVGNANGSAGFKACSSDGSFTVAATGFSTSSADVLYLASRQLCGNGEIIARVATVSGGGWGGIMLRENPAQGSKKVALKTQLTNNIRREIRSATNGAASILNLFRPQHTWLRLVRNGSNFTGYTSTDGTNWSFAFSATVSMTGCIYAGIFAESINAATMTTANFSNVNIIGAQNHLAGNPSGGVGDLDGIMPALDVSVFPNPTSGVVNMNFANAPTGLVNIQVFNTLGESILLKETEGAGLTTERLNLSDLADGVYFITVQATGYAPVTKRIVLAKTGSLRP